MPSKGFNSIIFDFFSLVDKELSMINYIIHEYSKEELENSSFDTTVLKTSPRVLTFNRTHGVEDVFRSVLKEELKDEYNKILDLLWERDEKEILEKYAVMTSLNSLIGAYRKAGKGIIQTAIYCGSQNQVDWVNKIHQNTNIETGERSLVNMSKYGRLIVGGYREALEYILDEPKSILILNYRDNFMENNINRLQPELIINFGDIHEIRVITAYPVDF